jgi:hypothetical protein
MEVKEFIATCKEVFPDCSIKGAKKKKHPCLFVYTSGVGYLVAHLWDDKCVAWVVARISVVSTIGHPKNLRINCNK